MIFYYSDIGYPMTWKTSMVGDFWYNIENVKIKVTLPHSVFLEIKSKFNTKESVFIEVLRDNSDKFEWSISSRSGLWVIETNIHSISMSSKFPNGDVIAIFNISVLESNEMDNSIFRSRLRDNILNKII